MRSLFQSFPWAAVLLALFGCLPPQSHGAGVTVITHGFNGDADGWVLGMAGRVRSYSTFPGTNAICYEVSVSYDSGYVVRSRKISGGNPATDPSTEIVIKLDWGDLAGFFSQYDTYEVASALVPRFLQTNFIAELNGHALAELPLHLIGHSRGGSLVCQMSRLLGTNGVWVDHLTTLDPHPVNEDGNTDPLFVSDAPLRVYENVLFADNIYQDFGGYPHGQLMPSSYNRRLTSLPGGYSSAHSDTHLWYHSTIDFRSPANDTEATLSAGDRASWFNTYESSGTRAGFHYSRIGGANRLSNDKPAGADSISEGYNQQWDFGAGTGPGPNRTSLPRVSSAWPNCIKASLAGAAQMSVGQTNAIVLHYQWARPATQEAAISLFLDDDTNPWNGNERLLQQATVAGTTSSNVFAGSLPFTINEASAAPGTHTLFVRFTAEGRTRYLYAAERLTIVPPTTPPALLTSNEPDGRIRVSINGKIGQRIVLDRTADFQQWEPIATNVLTSEFWNYLADPLAISPSFYRARIE